MLWIVGTVFVEVFVVVIAVFSVSRYWNQGKDPASMALLAMWNMIQAPVGILQLGASCAVVFSTGMDYLLFPSTNVMREILHRFSKLNLEDIRITFPMDLGMIVPFGL